jgi:transcription antitermination factor NusG
MKISGKPIFRETEPCRKWYIGYTMPKAEKKTFSRLNEIGVVSFLPMQKVVRYWSDRKKKLEVPLFPNYIFIYTSNAERFDILKMQGLVKYVSFGGNPATVSDSLIDSLKKMQTGDLQVSNIEFIEGMQVRITDGPFAGIEGTLVHKRDSKRIVVRIEVLKRAVSVDVSANRIEVINNGSQVQKPASVIVHV